jgi:hypothetical protein
MCSIYLLSVLLNNIVTTLLYTSLKDYKPSLLVTIVFLSVKKTQRVTV